MEMEGMPLSLTFVSSVAFRNKVGGERESQRGLWFPPYFTCNFLSM